MPTAAEILADLYGGARRSGVSLPALSAAVEEDQDPGVLSSVFRWLNRPGAAARSALTLNFGDAALNLLQFGLDIPTGGFLDPGMSLANALPGSAAGSLTTREQEPEFTDVLRRWGFSPPQDGPGRFALDFLGGIATDPLTYLSFGAAGVAEKVLAGGSRLAAGESLVQGLRQTERGAQVLSSMARQQAERAATRIVLQTDEALRAGRPRGLVPGGQDAARAADPERFEALVRVATTPLEQVSDETLRLAGRARNGQRTAMTREQAGRFYEVTHSRAGEAVYRSTVGSSPWQTFIPTSRFKAEAEATVRATAGLGPDDLLNKTQAADVANRTEQAVRSHLDDLGVERARGLDVMEDAGLLWRRGGVHVRVPFTKPMLEIPGVRDFWGGLAQFTAPALAWRTFSSINATADIAAAIKTKANEGWAFLRGQLYDRTARAPWGAAPREELRREVDELQLGQYRATAQASKLSLKAWGQYTDEQLGQVAKTLADTQAEFHALSRSPADALDAGLGASVEDAARRVMTSVGGVTEGSLEVASANRNATVDALVEAQRRLARNPGDDALTRLVNERKAAFDEAEALVKRWTGAREAQDAYESALSDVLMAKATRLGAVASGIPEEALSASLKVYGDSMTGVARDLDSLGVIPGIKPNPFYVPFQAAFDMSQLLADGVGKDDFRQAIRDVFTRRREHKTLDEFQAALEKVADKYGVRPDPDQLAELNVGVLMYRRLERHAATVYRAKMLQAGERHGMAKNGPVDRYIRGQIEALGPRAGVLKLFGGGKVEVAARPGGGLPLRARMFGDNVRALQRDGSSVPLTKANADTVAYSFDWKGLNYYYKTLLTSVGGFPAFHVRNLVSAVYMGVLDPDVGLSTVGSALSTIRTLPALRALTGRKPLEGWLGGKLGAAADRAQRVLGGPLGEGEAAKLLRAIHNPLDAAAQAAAKDVRVGAWTGEQIMAQVQGALLSSQAGGMEADLLEALGRMDAFGKPGAQPPGRFARLVDAVGAISDHVENGMRLGAYMTLLRKGIGPDQAVRRVNRIFVDYRTVSGFDRTLRDLTLFSRFTAAITPPVIEAAARTPRTLTPFARLQLSAQAQGGEPAFLPEAVRRGPAIPLGAGPTGEQQYLTSFGLPFEAAANALDVLPTIGMRGLRGTERSLLGQLAPPLRAPFEAVTGESFYYGDERPFRRAPLLLQAIPGATTKVTLPSGEVRYEVAPGLNELLNALPTNRAIRTVESFFDNRQGLVADLLRAGTGVRVTSRDAMQQARDAVTDYLRRASARGDVGTVEAFFQRDKTQPLPPDLERALEALPAIRREINERAGTPRGADTPLSVWDAARGG